MGSKHVSAWLVAPGERDDLRGATPLQGRHSGVANRLAVKIGQDLGIPSP